jgi:hypothetical protein
MHRRVVVSPDHRMGRVAKPEPLKAPPLTKLWALARSPDMNNPMSLMLGEYLGDIPSTNFVRPRD